MKMLFDIIVWTVIAFIPDCVFGYYAGDSLGVDKWHTQYPDCGGLMQSPVDIKSADVIYDKVLKPFDMTVYQSDELLTVKNKERHSLKLDYNGPDIKVVGGSLPDEYVVTQIHFHWGQADHHGSEHTVDGVGYPMEMHIVHHLWHQDKNNASLHPFGLAVIGYFIEFGDNNDAFDELLAVLDEIKEPTQKASVPFTKIRNLLPGGDKHHYHRYWGSLTTPPCSETVIWSVATKHIAISVEQLGHFKKFLTRMNQLMSNNYRPVQDINYRHVFSSDPKYVPLLGDGCSNYVKDGANSSFTQGMWTLTVALSFTVVWICKCMTR